VIYYPNCYCNAKVVIDGLGGADSKVLTLTDLRPVSASVGLNGYNQADTFECSFFLDDLPVSPEVLRSMSVDVYMGHTAKLESDPGSIIVPENLKATGQIDDAEISYSADGKVLRVQGRDYTQLFLDKKWPPQESIETGRELSVTIQAIVDKFQGGKGVKMAVEYRATTKQPIVGIVRQGVTARKATVSKPTTAKGRSRTTEKRIPVQSGRSYWDVIYELCLSYGFICFVDGDKLVIHEPKSLDEEAASKALYMAYGRNLADLSIARKFGRNAAPSVVATFYDPQAREHVEVEYPEAKKHPAGYGTVTTNYRRVVAPASIQDAETMRAFLRAAYEMFGRSEATIKFSTKALTGLQQDRADAQQDLTRLKPGDPIAIGVDTTDRRDLSEKKTVGERRQILINSGLRENVAQVIAERYDHLDELRRVFYTKSVDLSWSIRDGMTVSVEAINYIVPTRDAAK
jgi:hypothetical protein